MRLFPSTEEPFIKLRFDNFKTVTRDQTLPAATQDAHAIRRAAGECLKRVPLERRIRLLGVRIASLRCLPRLRLPRRLRCSIDGFRVARDLVAQPLAEELDLGRAR